MMVRARGFSLIELMIGISIACLLATMSIKAYTHHLTHVKRMLAESILLQLSASLSEYQIEHGSYKDASFTTLKHLPPLQNRDYAFSLAANAANSYELTATPQGAQAERDTCGKLMLEENGERKISGHEQVQDCW
jgi:type IV pilus assembly protein PilE